MSKKVLIIEDEWALQKVLRDQLEDAGFEVAQATEAEEGLRKIHDFMPNAIILDMILPRHDGFSILEDLQSHRSEHDIPVLVLTNLSDENNLLRINSMLGEHDLCLIKSNTNLGQIIETIQKLV